MGPLHAVRRDHHVDGLADGDTAASQEPVVVGREDGGSLADHWLYGHEREEGTGRAVVALVPKSLKYLREDEVADDDLPLPENAPQVVDLRRDDPVEGGNPDAGVDEDYASVRMASRSPSHLSFPK